MTHLELFTEFRASLLAQARRMPGNSSDAEDLLQETFLRWQQTSLTRIKSPRVFFSTIIREELKHQFAHACRTGNARGFVALLSAS